MNFETNQPFDQQLGKLLAIIIMFEKKIEELKKKLAGNQEFHTRLVFQRMDMRKRGEITPQDLMYSLGSENHNFNLPSCQALCRKYTMSGAISYQELLAMIIPKTDKALAQRMLLRTEKRGAELPSYLWKYFCQMFSMIISMTVLTEEIRKKIQNCAQLNHLQMVEFFKKILRSEEAVWRFCNENSDEQYDFSAHDTNYLSNNIRSGNSLRQMTDEDIKELICPLDMNFQKTSHQMAHYYDNIKVEKYKTEYRTFYHQTKADQQARKTANMNFLNSNYQSMYPNKNISKQNQNYNRNYPYNPYMVRAEKQTNFNSKITQRQNNNTILMPSRAGDTSNMYLDKFIKPLPYDSNRPSIELDRFLSGRSRKNQNGYEKFEDGLPENLDSQYSNSAFVQY